MFFKNLKYWVLILLILVALPSTIVFAKEIFYNLFFETQTADIIPQASTCPDKVKVWTSLKSFEGGAEHTAIANISSIAETAKVIDSNSKFVEYQAKLKSRYINCVGYGNTSSPNVYKFKFGDGKLSFRVALRTAQNGSTGFSEVKEQGIDINKPYVRWMYAEGY